MKRRVLLVEDNLSEAKLVDRMLRRASIRYELTHVESVEAAKRTLSELDFDALLLDLTLPDSHELSSVSDLVAVTNSPIIVMSGQEEEKTAIDALSAGAQDYLLKSNANTEIIHRAIGYAIERKISEERLTYLARHDSLTGLANRRTFLDRLNQALSKANRPEQSAPAVFLIDLDKFKQVNDTLGHGVGDKLLKEVAKRLEIATREMDLVSRIGGDEFAILLENTECNDTLVFAAERIIESLGEVFLLDGIEIRIAGSLGIAFPSDGYKSEEIMRHADHAMYSAKQSPREGAYCFYDQAMHQKAIHRQQIRNALNSAIEGDEYTLHFQPIFDHSNSHPVAFEALLRWENKKLGQIEPFSFIPILEEKGMIVEVGNWVLEKACHQLSKWQSRYAADLRMTVNVSAKEFENKAFVDNVESIVKDSKIAQGTLELEVTERFLMENQKASEESLKRLSHLGVRVAIDDFGTGPSQFVHLVQFPFTTLKIDRSLSEKLDTTNGRRLCEGVIALGHKLGFELVGKGIETPAQLHFFQENECAMLQGFYCGRPLTNEAAEALLQKTQNAR